MRIKPAGGWLACCSQNCCVRGKRRKEERGTEESGRITVKPDAEAVLESLRKHNGREGKGKEKREGKEKESSAVAGKSDPDIVLESFRTREKGQEEERVEERRGGEEKRRWMTVEVWKASGNKEVDEKGRKGGKG